MTIEKSTNSTVFSPTKNGARRRKRLRTILIVGLCLNGVLLLSHRSWLPWLHDYLDVSQDPHPADFAVVLGGGDSRVDTAVDLFERGLVSRIILSGCYPDIESELALLENNDVPSDKIIVNDHANSTWDESQQVLTLLQTEGAQSALIVTDKYHTRRARATYAHFSGDLDIQLAHVASSDKLSSDNWWYSKSGQSNVLNEYVKLVYYLLRYGIAPWER